MKRAGNNSSVFGSASEHRNSPNNRVILAFEATDMERCLLTDTTLNHLGGVLLFVSYLAERTPLLGWPTLPFGIKITNCLSSVAFIC